MSFEDLLRRKLGPMGDLLVKPSRSAAIGQPDPETLWYRRAAGLEVRVHPKISWAEAELGRAGRDDFVTLRMDAAATVAGLTKWTHASELAELGVRGDKLWKWVESDLLFYSKEQPYLDMTGSAGVVQPGQRIARRVSAWPTLAVETAVQIAPMPFMPRGRDLAGAEAVGFRFACLERGHEVYALNVIGDDDMGGVLRSIVALLDGRHTAEEIVASFDKKDRAAADKLVELLDRMTILEAADERTEAFAAGDEPQVTWLGHAGVLLQSKTTNVLFDPLFFSTSDPEEPHVSPAKFDPRTLPRIDAVVITHPDNDHLNPNSLSMIAPNVRVIVPRTGRSPPPYQVDTLGILRVLGFTDVVELEAWRTIDVGDITITGCPFVGESWDLDLAKLTYLAETDGLSIFCSADSAEMPDVYDRLAGRVTLAFMGVSGCAEAYVMPPDLGYGNFYEAWVPAVRRNEWVQHCAGPREAFASVGLLKPEFAFGYAAGGASYIRTAYSDHGDHDQLALLIGDDASEVDTKAVALPLGAPISRSGLAGLPPFSRSC